MKRGLAPQIFNDDLAKWESIELHHDPSQTQGGLLNFIELTPQQHEKLDFFRRLKKK